MAKYVFLNIPASGHVNPTLAVAQELVNRGQEVSYYLPGSFQDAVQATGAIFRPYESKLMERVHPTLMADECRHVLPQVMDRIQAEQPDVIVYEFTCVWARIVIHLLNVPAISLRSTYVMNEHFNLFSMMAQWRNQNIPNIRDVMAKVNAGMKEVCETYHVPPIELHNAFLHAEPLNIVFLPKVFQPAGDTFDKRYLFVGPSILPRNVPTDFPLDRLNSERPLLYISLGTMFSNQPEFFRKCFEAFGESDYQVVLSRGRQLDPAALGPVPDNFLVWPYVPQLDILPRTDVFVTHGGMNSVMESLYYGVPMVVIPQQGEQLLTARRSVELGVGAIVEKEDVTPERLREGVTHIIEDTTYRQHARAMQLTMREAGGYRRAVDAILAFQYQQTHNRSSDRPEP